MATLQNMEFQGDFELYSNICIVDEIRKGGEFTVCGLAIRDNIQTTGNTKEHKNSYSNLFVKICVFC